MEISYFSGNQMLSRVNWTLLLQPFLGKLVFFIYRLNRKKALYKSDAPGTYKRKKRIEIVVYLDLLQSPIQAIGASIDLAGVKLSTSRDCAMRDTTRGHVVEMGSTKKFVSVRLAVNRDSSPDLLDSFNSSVTLVEGGSCIVRCFKRALAVVAVAIDFTLPHDSSIIVTTAYTRSGLKESSSQG